MKYLSLFLILCMLFSGCTAAAPGTADTTTDVPIADTTLPEPTVSGPDYPVPPELLPTGEDSTAPAPEIGPEGLPTPTL